MSGSDFIAYFCLKIDFYLTQLSGKQQGQRRFLQGINYVFFVAVTILPALAL
uniref:Uncharacterized protein n=1 Tax=Rheinheimera sp. BAL341 TaxID=1708203 RepID=A0A486XME0_9GAMM